MNDDVGFIVPEACNIFRYPLSTKTKTDIFTKR